MMINGKESTYFTDYHNSWQRFHSDVHHELGKMIEVDWKNRIVYSDKFDEYFDAILEKYHPIIAHSTIKSPPPNTPIEERRRINKLINEDGNRNYEMIKQELRKEFPKIIEGFHFTVISREQERAFEEYWDNLSFFEKRRLRNSTIKKPASLKEGWVIYIAFMLFAIILQNPFGCWFVITMLFLIWRRNEINKYN